MFANTIFKTYKGEGVRVRVVWLAFKGDYMQTKSPVIDLSRLSKAKRTPSPSSKNFSWRNSFQKENIVPGASPEMGVSFGSSVL